MPNPPTVFISYRRELSVDLAQRIHDYLTRQGAKVFLDLDSMPGGERWRARLLRELATCDYVLAVLAPKTLESEWVRYEIKTALDLNKTVIPVTHHGFTFSHDAIPPEISDLSEFNAIPFVDRYSSAAFDEIKRALGMRHTLIPSPALAEETQRRLDAATPSQTQISNKTEIEVRVKIVQPNSGGLRDELPAVAISGDTIHKHNVVPSNFPIQFDEDDSGHLSASLCIKLQADGFKVRSDFSKGDCGNSAVALKISPNTDSQTITFFLSPKAAPQAQSLHIRVSVFQKGNLIAQVTLQTELVEQVERISITDYWNLISTFFTQRPTQTFSEVATPATSVHRDSIPSQHRQSRPVILPILTTMLSLFFAALALVSEEWRNDFFYKIGLFTATPLSATLVVIAPSNTPTPTDTPTDVPTATDFPTITPLPPTATPTPIITNSPVTGRIAFISNRDGSEEIYVMNADGSNPVCLTANGTDDFTPNWSPDGRQIAYASEVNGNVEIYVMNADGSNQRNITNSPNDDYSPDWSPDGKRIAFHTFRDGNSEIYVMNADGSNPVRLTTNSRDDASPVWSPDGMQIAFDSQLDSDTYLGEIYLMNADGTNPVRLTTTVGNDDDPVWSPDGKQIAFVSYRDGHHEIYVMNADGSNPHNLTNSFNGDLSPSWSPDGAYLFFTSNRDNNYEIYVMNADGSNQRNLTNNPAYDAAPDFAPAIISVTNTSVPQAPIVLTATPMPTIPPTATVAAKSYPCEATIDSSGRDATFLQIVYSQPLPQGIRLDPIRVDARIQIVDKRSIPSKGTWYRIAELNGTSLGWVHTDNLNLSANCPA